MVSDGMALRGSPADPKSGGSTGGYYVYVSEEFEEAASGGSVEVTVVARSEDGDPLTFGVAYSTRSVGNSSWREFEAGEEFSSFSFTFDVNPMEELDNDAIGIVPELGGGERGLVVESISAAIVG